MTQKQVIASIKALGMSVRVQDGEYRIAYPGRGNEDIAYYTSSKEDAVNTAKHMVAWSECIQSRGVVRN